MSFTHSYLYLGRHGQATSINIPPTPAAGLMLTSMAASSGISSLRCTSKGPLIEAKTEMSSLEKTADPSAPRSEPNWPVIAIVTSKGTTKLLRV